MLHPCVVSCVLVALLLSVCCAGGVRGADVPSTTAPLLRLLLLGDTGGRDSAPFTTPALRSLAYGMENVLRVAEGRDHSDTVSAAVLMGDNVYQDGVTSATDHRFNDTFEVVFGVRGRHHTRRLASLRKYMTLGNHDHFGNVSAQLAYTGTLVPRVASQGRQPSYDVTSWHLPAAYYVEDLPQRVRLIVTDSTTLIRELSDQQEESQQWQWLRHEVRRAAGEAAVDTLLVVTHHPMLSAAEYSGNRKLVQYLMPLLEEAVAAGRLRVVHCAGHSHTLQHLRHNGVDYIVTGAASQVNLRRPNWFNVPLGSLRFLWPPRPYTMGDYPPTNYRLGGFVSLEVSAANRSLHFFNASGAPLYSQQIR